MKITQTSFLLSTWLTKLSLEGGGGEGKGEERRDGRMYAVIFLCMEVNWSCDLFHPTYCTSDLTVSTGVMNESSQDFFQQNGCKAGAAMFKLPYHWVELSKKSS